MRPSVVRPSVVVASLVLVGGAVLAAGPAQASARAGLSVSARVIMDAPTSTNGDLAYTCLNRGGSGVDEVVVVDSLGTKHYTLFQNPTMQPTSTQWSADGTELVHAFDFDAGRTTGGVTLTEADGSFPWGVTNWNPQVAGVRDQQGALSPDGQDVFMSRAGKILAAPASGLYDPSDAPQTVPGAQHPFVAQDGDLYYDTGAGGIYTVPSGSSTATAITTTGPGVMPRVSPDGTLLSYVVPGGTDAVYESQLDGTSPVMVARFGSGGVITGYDWAPDGTKVLFAQDGVVYTQTVPMGPITQIGGTECTGGVADVAWQPRPIGHEQVVRAAGLDRVGTSIAVSHQGFPSDGSADAVVLADSLAFPDALSGAPLAAMHNAPLLLSPPTALDPRVLTEIGRVLKPASKQVYIVGGYFSMSLAVEQALTDHGYTVTRFAGADRYDTSLKVAQSMGTGATAPEELMLATGTDFPDGVSAGAAAGSYWTQVTGAPGGAVLLTKGGLMPPATLQYVRDAISGHIADPDHQVFVTTVGGLADKAYTDSYVNTIRLVGADRYQTSAFVAEVHFGAVPVVSIATGLSFPDALSGGALAAELNAPVVLAPPSLTTSTETAYYLHAMSGAISLGFVFGGPVVVSTTVEHQLGSIIGLSVDYSAPTVARTAATASSRAAAAQVAAAKAAARSGKEHPVGLAPHRASAAAAR